MTKSANNEKLLKKQAKKDKKAAKKAMYPEYNAGKKKVTMYYIIAIAIVFAIGLTLALLTSYGPLHLTDQQQLWSDNRLAK